MKERQLLLFHEDDTTAIPVSPRQFEIKIIPPRLACALNAKWHSSLPHIPLCNVVRNTRYICFGALYNSNWYAVAIWTSPVAQNRFKDGKHILELRRFAISDRAPKNTGSYMMARMIETIKKLFLEITRLISYQDTQSHDGALYKACNWKPAGLTKFVSWTTKKRKRNPEQVKSDKIRWEFKL
jgi:hypothetical protein